MRCVRILVLLGLVASLATSSSSQTLASKDHGTQPPAQLSQRMVSLREALASLSEAYQVDFVYEDDVVQGKTALLPSSLSNNLEDDLNQVLAPNPLTYAKVGARTIVISPREPVAPPPPPAGGTLKGKLTDERGEALAFVQVFLEGTTKGDVTDQNGEYVIENVPPGTYTLRARLIGYRPKTAEVTVAEGVTVTQDFTLSEDPLKMGEVVVTGTRTPRLKLETPLAISTLSPREIEQAVPRSTTEMLRYVPGFTRVESSGGEVNQNISVRGIYGVEFVMFMEDGMPVFPTMHTFFMNADNLFRPDENIDRIEVVRGGNAALYGSNTPGAIINFLNKTGGPEISGRLRATGGSGEYARYDFNVNGPLGENWRFNLGGFYRYDRGVRNPGYPGIRGGQLKANVTRLLSNGYVRTSLKFIDDRNQFILPLPFQNPDDPKYVSGFSNFGAMSTLEGVGVRVPLPLGNGELELPLDDGLRTRAYWLTNEIGFDFAGGWSLQNSAQLMSNEQGWNAIVPFDVLEAKDWAESVLNDLKAKGFVPANARYRLLFTNHFDARGNKLPFNTANGLLAPGGEWHVEKPISAFQDQIQLKKTIQRYKLSAGLYVGYYTQTNRWFFTEILTDIRDNPRFVDMVVDYPSPFTGQDTTLEVTKNGFRRFLSLHLNGSGHTTIFSPFVGAELQLTDRLRADLGARFEHDNFVQVSENSSNIDLDGDPRTIYDNENWRNGTFRHFDFDFDEWAGSAGLNYTVTDQLSVYGQGSFGFKMPALDEYLFPAEAQAALFKARHTTILEAGAKYSTPKIGVSATGFWGELRDIFGQGLEADPVTRESRWVTRESPKSRSYGGEVEVSARPVAGLSLLGAGTFLKPQTVPGTGAALTAGGIPSALLNLSATYTVSGLTLLADWHYVGARDLIFADYDAVQRRYTRYDKVGELKTYTYLNLGAFYKLPRTPITFSADLLNLYQSKGFEEGNPRLPAAGGRNLFLARPILPRRLLVSVHYDF